MIEFRKGHFFTVDNVLRRNNKNYIQIGRKFIEAEVQGHVEKGEKLAVVSMTDEKIVLTSYSKLFKNRAFEDILKSFNIPMNTNTFRLLQLFFSLEIPMMKEKFERIYSKIKNLKIPSEHFPLAVLKDKELDSVVMDKITSNQMDFQQLAQFFLSLSNPKEILLPINSEGSFVYIQPKENQFYYSCFLDFTNLDLIYVKGWISKDGKLGETTVFIMPFTDFGYLKPIFESLKKQYPQMRFNQKYFQLDSLRSVDGFF